VHNKYALQNEYAIDFDHTVYGFYKGGASRGWEPRKFSANFRDTLIGRPGAELRAL
jgi:hypothetical protein